ncbi:hypothetical protein [Roseomonas elaeocarpi]|uniref:DUF2335 domain-containing protein n=1 Tax=Roseomonas elaeocarpi TaxID=907779 RepID=A0ABV6JRD7_9PROT
MKRSRSGKATRAAVEAAPGEYAPPPRVSTQAPSAGLPQPHITLHTTELHEGPIPHYTELAGYGQVQADFPERIMRMAEENAAAERRAILEAPRYQFNEQLIGRLLGAGYAFATLGASVALALYGHDAVASILGGSTIVLVTVALVTGKKP